MQVFFSDSASDISILSWIVEETVFGKDNIFSLNEQHSCTVEPRVRDGVFFISGDEDLKTLTLEEIKPIVSIKVTHWMELPKPPKE